MTDIRKVISPLNGPSTTVGNTKTPEGDRPVFYNRSGQLDLDQPFIYSTIKTNNLVANAATSLNSAASFQILGGTFYSSTNTLNACDFDPYHFLIRCVPGAAIVLTFPDPGGAAGIIPYLKSKYGAENITDGMMWRIRFINDVVTAGRNVTLRLVTPGAGNGSIATVGIQPVGGNWDDVMNAQNTSPNSNSSQFVILLTNVTPGSEAITWTRLN